jgi:transcriptional regulator with XRE-family HTH domain
MTLQFLTPEELASEVGSRLKALRIDRRIEQADLAERAGVSIKALRSLEQGHGSTLETFLRALKGLEALDGLEALAPRPTINPLALLDHRRPPRRVRNPKGRT